MRPPADRSKPEPEFVPTQVRALCDEFGIRIIHRFKTPNPGETRAVATISKIIGKRGEPHARMVLSLLAESRGNAGLIDEVGLWAMSDLVTACVDVVEDRATDLFDLMDGVPLGAYMAIASELSGVVSQRYALVGMLYLHMRRLRDKSISFRSASTYKQRRVNASEYEKGRLPGYRPRPKLTRSERIDLGRGFLAKKVELGGLHGLMRWAVAEQDLPLSTVSYCMRLAREADAKEAAT